MTLRTSLLNLVAASLISQINIAAAAQGLENGGANLYPKMESRSLMLPLEVDGAMAPVALYPDPILSEVLMAATYPNEVKEANEWREQPDKSKLFGDELIAALQRQRWDPSVKSLVAFPDVLKMMAENPGWMEQAGNLFLLNQADVMDTIQWLRQKAVATGYFRTNSAEVLTAVENNVILEPPERHTAYVPVCNVWTVYGRWPDRDHPPYDLSRSFPGISAANPFSCGWVGAPIADPLWAWSSWDWTRHRLIIDRARFLSLGGDPVNVTRDGAWHHHPNRRQNVTYYERGTAART